MARPEGFPSRYPTVCHRCNGEIRKDDRVVYQGTGVIHTTCASGQDDE